MSSKAEAHSMRGKNLSVYYHTHWDREWYMPFRSYQVRLGEVVDEVLDLLESGGLPCFTLDGQTVVLEDYLEIRPENRERLQKLIQAGKISIGPWYVMPDEFLVSGESLIRNLMRGIREARAWGYDSFTGYLPDTFGHSADMPTILRGFGIDSAILWRGLNPKQSILNWQSPSGATVRTLHLTDGYFQMMLDDWTATPEEQIAALDKLVGKLEAASPQDGLGLMPMGADHMGPLPAAGRKRLLERYPHLTETTADQFMQSLNGLQNLETVQGELMDNSGSFLLPGVWSSRMYLKQANRKLEHALTHRLEPLLAMSQTLLPEAQRPRYPVHELDLAWKTLLLNHPHDSICGCSVDAVHRESEVRFEQVEQLCEAMTVRVEHAFRQLGTADEWVIFNTGDTPYTGVVPVVEEMSELDATFAFMQQADSKQCLQDEYLHDAHRIPLAHLQKTHREGWIWVEDVPAFGVATVPKKKFEVSGFSPVNTQEQSLENEFFAITVSNDGAVQVMDKRTGKQYANLFYFAVREEQGDSYNSASKTGAQRIRSRFLNLPTENMAMTGALVGELELFYACEGEGVAQDVELYFSTFVRLKAGCPWVELDVTVSDTAEHRHKIQMVFETTSPVELTEAETHLGVVSRWYDPTYQESQRMPVEKMKELKTNTGPVQRFFSAQDQSWLTQGLTEYEVYQNTVAITLLRPFDFLSKDDTAVRGAQAGPPLLTSEGLSPNRVVEGHLAWMPTPEDPAKLYEAAGRFYGNVWGFSGKSSSPKPAQRSHGQTSMMTWDNPVLVSSACYWLPGKGLILRLLNTTDTEATTTFTPGFAVESVWTVNFLEEPQAELPGQTITLGSRGVQTLLFAPAVK